MVFFKINYWGVPFFLTFIYNHSIYFIIIIIFFKLYIKKYTKNKKKFALNVLIRKFNYIYIYRHPINILFKNKFNYKIKTKQKKWK